MHHNGYVAIGTFINLHGYKGKLTAVLYNNQNKKIKFPEPIFVEIQQILVPFFFDEVSISGQKFIVKIKGVENELQAMPFKKKEIFVEENYYNQYLEIKIELNTIGFEIFDSSVGYIGIVEEILEYPGQNLYKIISSKKEEILIPINATFIKKIDVEMKTILVTTPEGLLDLYMSKD